MDIVCYNVKTEAKLYLMQENDLFLCFILWLTLHSLVCLVYPV